MGESFGAGIVGCGYVGLLTAASALLTSGTGWCAWIKTRGSKLRHALRETW
jgi:hypothetical protein